MMNDDYVKAQLNGEVDKPKRVSIEKAVINEITEKVFKEFEDAIKLIKFPDITKVMGNVTSTVSNFPLVQKVTGDVMAKVTNFPPIQKIVGKVEVDFPKVQKVEGVVRLVDNEVKLDFPDTQKVRIVNPTKQFELPPVVPVKITNWQLAPGGGDTSSFVNERGEWKQGLVDEVGHVQVDVKTMPDITLTTGDIEIGAVEIKNATDDTRATVGSLGLHVDPQPLTTIYNNTKTVPTGTAEAIASSQAIHSVTVKALSTNTVAVYVGATGVTTSSGFELLAGESITLDVSNLASVFCISGTSSQVIRYIAV
jgi:hypothetical protein